MYSHDLHTGLGTKSTYSWFQNRDCLLKNAMISRKFGSRKGACPSFEIRSIPTPIVPLLLLASQITERSAGDSRG